MIIITVFILFFMYTWGTILILPPPSPRLFKNASKFGDQGIHCQLPYRNACHLEPIVIHKSYLISEIPPPQVHFLTIFALISHWPLKQYLKWWNSTNWQGIWSFEYNVFFFNRIALFLLRLPGTYALKLDPSCTLSSITIIDNLSKIWGVFFWQSDLRLSSNRIIKGNIQGGSVYHWF